MKSIIIIGDGMSDHPVQKLGGKTPLMVANKPHIDQIARKGRMGLFATIPEGQPNGSAVANLSVLGYDPEQTFQGRAVLEAASMGVDLSTTDVATRCNLICVEDDKIKNHSAGHISTEEADEIITTLDKELGNSRGDLPVTFHSGVSYRHLLVLRGEWASPKLTCYPPHDYVGENAVALLPSAAEPAAKSAQTRIEQLYHKSMALLADHPVNVKRKAAGKDPANAIWPWSPGCKPSMQTMQQRFGLRGATISAVDLVLGLGKYAGMTPIDVPGATGLWDTNYEGKASACLDALADHDFVYVHVEATDEAGHAQDLDLKIKCIEMLDQRLVRPILEGLTERGIEATVAILPDHPTPVETGKHADDPVPVAIFNPNITPDNTERYDEIQAATGSLGPMQGDTFIKTVLNPS
jgi:2,3-bisphosphoglycerate-independent phosphoglycerate mutase